MTKEKALKLQAKKHLYGNRPATVGATLTVIVALMSTLFLPSIIYSLLASVPTIALPLPFTNDFSEIVFVISILLCISAILPLIVGYFRFCYLMTKYSYCDYSQLFFYYSKGKFFSSIKISFAIILRSLWQAVVSALPVILGISVYGILSELLEEIISSNFSGQIGDYLLDFTTIICYYIIYILVLVGIMLFFILTKSNFLAIYHYIENDHLKASDICRFSKSATSRFGKDIVRLNFSFIPMMLLCVLVIPCIFVLPYIITTKATAAKWMIAISYRNEA